MEQSGASVASARVIGNSSFHHGAGDLLKCVVLDHELARFVHVFGFVGGYVFVAYDQLLCVIVAKYESSVWPDCGYDAVSGVKTFTAFVNQRERWYVRGS